ncbi:helix-turn-helix transcriptional regulator [Streptomyces huasconensis]|uniref:helix-turn-helix transcriptional regulator n=1 Tax=Streptomyces huasconensis TaxID=1854574 RepID=UPI0034004908
METPLGFGAELRRLREDAGKTLEYVSRKVNYSKGHLSKVERGHKKPTVSLARRCDSLFSTGGRLSRLLATPNPLQTDRGQDRREVLSAGMGSLVAVTMGTQAAEPRAVDVSQPPIARFQDQLQQMRMLGQTNAPHTLLVPLRAQARTITRMAARSSGRTRSALLVTAARFAEYAGWMAQEAGDVAGALNWTAQAVELAQAGGDTDLADYAMIRRALVALYQQDADGTVALARQAQRSTVAPQIRRMAAQRVAQGHALGGNETACLNELDRARSFASRSELPGDGWLLGPTHLADPVSMVTGWCLHDLGRHRDAADILDRECGRIPHHAVRTRVRYGLRRALAHSAAGEVDKACEVAWDLLLFVDIAPSATVHGDVVQLDRELRRFRSHPAVRELRPVLADAAAGC